jgi:hypothetical protein
MSGPKTTFALFFGNRGFFPASLIAEAREELPRVLKEWGYEVLMLEEEATRYGARQALWPPSRMQGCLSSSRPTPTTSTRWPRS